MKGSEGENMKLGGESQINLSLKTGAFLEFKDGEYREMGATES